MARVPDDDSPRDRRHSAGEGSVYERTRTRTLKDGSIVTATYWVATLTVPGTRKRLEYQGRTRALAVKKREEAKTELAKKGRLHTGRQTVGQFLEEWLESKEAGVKASTFAAYEHYTRAHLIPGLGKIRLTKLTPEDVEKFMRTKLAAKMAPQTVRHLRAILRHALNIAIRRGRLSLNPAQLVDPPRVPKKKQRRLTADQARTLLSSFQGHRLGALFTLALGLGMRQGQALGLRWEDVDFEGAKIHLERALVRVGGEYFLDEPKNETSAHVLPLPTPLADVLHAHKATQNRRRLTAGPEWLDNDLVFTTELGAPLNRHVVTHEFQKLLPTADLPHMTFHDLRGSCATLLAALGVHPRVAMEILGHADFGTTMRYYTDALTDSQKDAMDRYGKLLWGKGGES
jgi:integrase